MAVDEEVVDLARVEIRYAEVLDEAFGCVFFQDVPCFSVILFVRCRPVEEHEVDPADVEPFKALFNPLALRALAHFTWRDLRCDEEGFPVDAALPDAAADGFFIAIHGCGVNETVACFDGCIHRIFSIIPECPCAGSSRRLKV